jgi:hypothetical protein
MSLLPNDNSFLSQQEDPANTSRVSSFDRPIWLNKIVPAPPMEALDTQNAKLKVAGNVDARQNSASSLADPKKSTAKAIKASMKVPNAQQSLRAHYTRAILQQLEDIQEHACTPDAGCYAWRMLDFMRALRDATPEDPYLDVVMALHDALAFRDRWAFYTAAQYAAACTILKDASSRQRIDNTYFRHSLAKLEAAGFDTLPFGEDYMGEEEDE